MKIKFYNPENLTVPIDLMFIYEDEQGKQFVVHYDCSNNRIIFQSYDFNTEKEFEKVIIEVIDRIIMEQNKLDYGSNWKSILLRFVISEKKMKAVWEYTDVEDDLYDSRRTVE